VKRRNVHHTDWPQARPVQQADFNTNIDPGFSAAPNTQQLELRRVAVDVSGLRQR